MSQEKYIGMDVHQATISVAVMDAGGKLIMECLLETKASTIVEFIQGLQGTLSLTFEEGTSAAWLHDLLKPLCLAKTSCTSKMKDLVKSSIWTVPIRSCHDRVAPASPRLDGQRF